MNKISFYYGIILITVGVSVFFRIPEVMLRLETIEFFKHNLFIAKTVSYILGSFLIIAGGLRVYRSFK